VVRRGSALLVVRRPPRGLFGGLWAPPSAEVAPGEDPRRALAAAARHGQGLSLRVGEEVAACERILTHRALTLRAFRCEARRAIPESAGLRFAAPGVLGALGVPAAVRDLLARI
jgi:A/G-specific adenine glycosylase